MTATPPIGFQATLTVNDGSAAAQQPFAFPISISCPFSEVGKVDRSYLGMATKDKLYSPTLWDNGEMEFEIQYTKADYQRLLALKGVEKTWVVTFPDDGTGTPLTRSFNGWVCKAPTKFEMEAIVVIQASVQVNGPIT